MAAYRFDAETTGTPAPPGDAGAGHDPILILGAGIAGLGAAKRLAALGHAVTVIDGAAGPGGTHRSREIGPYTFDVGSIFYEENALLFSEFPGTASLCPPARRVQRRISPDGKTMHYPVDPRDILSWPAPRLASALIGLIGSRLFRRRNGTLDAVCLQRLGKGIYQGTGLRDYIQRFNHVPAAALDEEFFFRRMAFLERQTRLGAMVTSLWRAVRRRGPRKGPPALLRIRPPEGFHALFGPIRAQLEAMGVNFAFGSAVTSVTKTPGGFAVQTGAGSYTGRAVLGAMPVDALYAAVFGQRSGLQSIDLLTLFVSAARLPEGFGNVLFNFHPQGRWKRATIYSRLYNGLGAGREFLAVEVTLPPGASPDPEAAYADFAAHLSSLGLGVEGLALEGHELVEAAYPLYLAGKAGMRSKVLQELEDFGILPIGRQGRFEYLATAGGVLRRVHEDLADSALASSATAPRA